MWHYLAHVKVVVLCLGSGWREGEDDQQRQRAHEGQQNPRRTAGVRGDGSTGPAQTVSLSECRGGVLIHAESEAHAQI